MTYAEILQAVYDVTNRPDLSAETALAIQAATLKAHKSDFFSKDIFETGLQFTTVGFIQSLDIISLYSNYRALKYIRKYDDVGMTEGPFLDIITPDQLLDGFGRTKVDIGYVAGRNLELRSSTELDKMLIGFYVSPIITIPNYSSWIAEQYPFAIIYDAIRVIFKSIGYDEQAITYRELVGEQYQELKTGAVTDVGS